MQILARSPHARKCTHGIGMRRRCGVRGWMHMHVTKYTGRSEITWTHAHSLARTHACMHTRSLACSHAHSYRRMHTCMHAQAQTACTHARTHAHMQAHIHICMHAWTVTMDTELLHRNGCRRVQRNSYPQVYKHVPQTCTWYIHVHKYVCRYVCRYVYRHVYRHHRHVHKTRMKNAQYRYLLT